MNPSNIDRIGLLEKLIPNPDDFLFISGLSGPAKDAATFINDGSNLFAMAGTMGAAVPVGLGLALSAPESKVIVITGDGELLMNVGSLVTVATAAPSNLSIICIDNAQHGETGRQTGHTAHKTDLAKMAAGAGIESVATIVEPEEIESASMFLIESNGPRFLWTRVMAGPPSAFKRNFNADECRIRFKEAYLNKVSRNKKRENVSRCVG